MIQIKTDKEVAPAEAGAKRASLKSRAGPFSTSSNTEKKPRGVSPGAIGVTSSLGGEGSTRGRSARECLGRTEQEPSDTERGIGLQPISWWLREAMNGENPLIVLSASNEHRESEASDTATPACEDLT